jgi:hypothetical protein
MSRHEILGEDLAALETGGSGGRTKDRQPSRRKEVDDAPVERQFRADDGQLDLFADRHVEQPVDVPGIDGDRSGESGDAGVARRAQHRRHRAVAAEGPNESVLTATAADDEDFHERGCEGRLRAPAKE